jgi:hypothetical protein
LRQIGGLGQGPGMFAGTDQDERNRQQSDRERSQPPQAQPGAVE